MISLNEQFANYLNQKEFSRFIQAWIEKYQQLGHLGGKITLEHLTGQEQKALGGLLSLDLSSGSLSITYSTFEKRIQKTRFEGVDFLQVLNILNGNVIQTKKEARELRLNEWQAFKMKLTNQFDNTFSNQWLNSYLEEAHCKRYYHDNKPRCYQVLECTCQLLNQLPVYENRFELLAVLAQQVSQNPHFFDEEFPLTALCKGIRYLLELDDSLSNQEVLNQAGILKDELANHCYICHIQPKLIHQAWHQFYLDYEPWNMNLYNLSQIQSDFEIMDIYIVENPSVFRHLQNYAKSKQLPIGLVCSNGQINGCTYLLFDRLVKSGCHLYYAGDFDPEGLLIADKLKQRYNHHLDLWLYNLDLFKKIQTKQIQISSRRNKILERIENEILKEIAHGIQMTSTFAYQEGLIEDYIEALETKYIDVK